MDEMKQILPDPEEPELESLDQFFQVEQDRSFTAPLPAELQPGIEAEPVMPLQDLPEGVVDWQAEFPESAAFDEPQVPPLSSPAAEADPFTDPFVAQNIEADEQSIAYHGMAYPSDPEPDYRAYLYEEDAGKVPESTDELSDSQEDQELTAIFSAESSQEEAEVPQKKNRPVRKGRPKRKKGDGLLGIPHLLSTVVWLAIILLTGITLGRMVWVCAADVLAFGRQDRTVTITVESSDTIDTIAEKLYNAGLIRYPGLFRLYADLTVDEGDISTGTFTLNTLYDYHALVGGMSSGSSYRAVIEDVLIPEGYSCRQIFELLEKEGICTVAELEEYAANGEFADYWFLEGVQRGDKYCLEGYLFPDTYDFYENSTPREALGRMLTGFNSRVDEQLYGKLTTLNNRLAKVMRDNGKSEEYIQSHLLTFHDVVTVASLIEKETANNKESYTIASVIYNRLYDWGNTPAYLNIDAAIIYAMDGDATHIDTSLDSPYNTYRNTGLTPGPIANPGIASLTAALEPADSDYYYYVLNPATGQHTFSRTLKEHEALVEQYRKTGGN